MLSDMKETTEILQLHLPTKAMGRLTQSDTNVFIPARLLPVQQRQGSEAFIF